MTMRYLIRCGKCGEDAPVVGTLLSELSEHVATFQAAHDHAEGAFVLESAPGQPEVTPALQALLAV